MTNRQIENRIKKLQEIESQIAALEQDADAIRSEIKADMEEKGIDELQTKNFFIRWKEIFSNRLDSKALKAQMPDVYKMFVTTASCKRFTIA